MLRDIDKEQLYNQLFVNRLVYISQGKLDIEHEWYAIKKIICFA